MRNCDELDKVFASDANGMLHGVECIGRDAIKAHISKAVAWFDVTQHLISNHQVTIAGDTATHRCQMQAAETSQHFTGHAKDGAELADARTRATQQCTLETFVQSHCIPKLSVRCARAPLRRTTG
ncbi:MAG: nuclear transport factor 2 family protein [Actinomycetota bacterium]